MFPLVPLPKKCVTFETPAIKIYITEGFPLVPLPKKCVTLESFYIAMGNPWFVSISSTSEEVRDVWIDELLIRPVVKCFH